LIHSGADASMKNSYGWTALELATKNNHKDTVEALIAFENGQVTPLLSEEEQQEFFKLIDTGDINVLTSLIDTNPQYKWLEKGTFILSDINLL
jgi:ankyrin repeat protein